MAASATVTAAAGAPSSGDGPACSDFTFHLTPTYSTGLLFTSTTACVVLKFLVATSRVTGPGFYTLTSGYSKRAWRKPVSRLTSTRDASDPPDDSDDSDDGLTNSAPGRPQRLLLDVLPAPGDYSFTFGADSRAWRLRIVQGTETHLPSYSSGEIVRSVDVALTVRAAGPKAAREAVEELYAAAAEHAVAARGDPTRQVRVTTITGSDAGESYFSRSSEGRPVYLPKRPLTTIYLPDSIKARANDELAAFLRSKKDYARFGIPFRRSMLFAGPPGLGKTSLIHALASEHSLPIYMVRIGPKSSDDGLAASLRGVSDKRGALLVIEDVDALFNLERAQDREKTTHAVSFSGLLNALDGLGAPSGVVLVLTTNHLDRLDPALLRPGRIDSVYTFAAPSAPQIAAMIAALVPAVPPPQRDAIVARIGAEPACVGLSTAVLQKWLFDARNKADLERELPALLQLCDFFKERAAAAHRKAPEEFYG